MLNIILAPSHHTTGISPSPQQACPLSMPEMVMWACLTEPASHLQVTNVTRWHLLRTVTTYVLCMYSALSSAICMICEGDNVLSIVMQYTAMVLIEPFVSVTTESR